jgi:Nif-specific regulatory protein
MLMHYHWPGNVRELENCLERAVILCTDGVIHGYLLPPNLQRGEANGSREKSGTFKSMMTGLERELIAEGGVNPRPPRSRASSVELSRAAPMPPGEFGGN